VAHGHLPVAGKDDAAGRAVNVDHLVVDPFINDLARGAGLTAVWALFRPGDSNKATSSANDMDAGHGAGTDAGHGAGYNWIERVTQGSLAFVDRRGELILGRRASVLP